MDTPPPLEPGPPAPPPAGPSVAQWKTILHLSGLAVLLVPTGGNIIAPLIIWLIKKTDQPELDAEGRKVLNFQISYTIYVLLAGVLASMLIFLITPFALPFLVTVAWLILTIVGAVKTSNGESYQYPFTIRIL